MEIGFTACLTQEILALERETQQIQQLDAFYIMVWNHGSKTIVVSMWDEYSRHLPPENFHSQKAFLQKLADQFKTPLPKRMVDRKILEVIVEESRRLKNDSHPTSFHEIEEHVGKLSAIMRLLEHRTGQDRSPGVAGPAPVQHYNCRSTLLPEPSSFAQAIIERVTRRLAESVGQTIEREFRNRVLGEPTPPRAAQIDDTIDSLRYMAQASTLTAESIARAVEVMSRSGFQAKDHRFRDCETLERKTPKMKLGEIDQKLQEWGHTPSLDHEESKVMPGMSKGVAGYIMLNDKLKVMLDGLCDLNRWKP